MPPVLTHSLVPKAVPECPQDPLTAQVLRPQRHQFYALFLAQSPLEQITSASGVELFYAGIEFCRAGVLASVELNGQPVA